MAELKLEEMLKIMHTGADRDLNDSTYKAAVSAGYFVDTPINKADFLTTVGVPIIPPASGGPAIVLAPGATSAQMYDALPIYGRQMLIADLAMSHYQNRQSLNQKKQMEEQSLNQKKQMEEQTLNQKKQSFGYWRNVALATAAAGALALFGRSQIPSVSIDESVAQYEVQKQEVDVQDYMRTHEGKSPPWQKSPEQIRMDTAKDYTLEKSALYGIGILGVLGGIISGIASAIYLGLSKRK